MMEKRRVVYIYIYIDQVREIIQNKKYFGRPASTCFNMLRTKQDIQSPKKRMTKNKRKRKELEPPFPFHYSQ